MNAGAPSRRRVLHLVGASEDHGGILSVIRGLAAAPQGDWEHVLWVNSRFQQSRQPVLPCRFSPAALDESPGHLRLLAAALRSWPDLRRLQQAEPFDLFHAHSRGALPLAWLARRRRIPVVFTNHAYARRTGLYRAAVRSGLPMVLLTPAMARHYRLEPRPGEVEVISACFADRFLEAPLPARPPAEPAGRLRVTGIGNITRWKKWDVLVEALRLLDPALRGRVDATVWGPVPDDADSRRFHGEVQAAIDRHGLAGRIRLAGPTRNIPEILSRSDVFVLPSTNEPCSVALMEALASGVPVLASASGGNGDIVQDGVGGRLFTPDDPGSLRDALAALLEGRFRPAAPAVIREGVRHRSATAVAAQYRQLYSTLATAGTRR